MEYENLKSIHDRVAGCYAELDKAQYYSFDGSVIQIQVPPEGSPTINECSPGA